jgi:TRAP-type C4-dicarboxylate transport system substrate-binding protein
MLKIKRISWGTLVLSLGLVFGFGSQASAEKIKVKIGSGHSPSWHFVSMTQSFFIPEVSKRVKERTSHEIEFVENWSGSAVKTTEVLEAVEQGILDFGVFCICHEAQKLALNNFPMFLPFGPSDPELSVKATRKVYDTHPQLNEQFTKHRQRLLTLVPFEPYNIVSRSPINKSTDVNGKKVGAAGPNAFWVSEAGALPVSVPGPDMYTSLQTGLIESMIIFLSVMDSLKLFDVAPNFVDVSFGSMTVTSLTVNNRKFDKLPRDVQQIILEVAKEMEARGGKVTKELGDKTLANAKSKGVNVQKVSDSDRKEWAALLTNPPKDIAIKYENESKVPMRVVMKAYIAATEAEGYVWPAKAKLD